MQRPNINNIQHAHWARRSVLQAGAIGILGLGSNHLWGLRDASGATIGSGFGQAKSCIFIFLSGGLSQHESFDMKPDAPEEIRGEFRPISTRTTDLHICEHLPRLANCSPLWSLVRSLTHASNDHSVGHHVMLTGRSAVPTGFSPNTPSRSDYPSIASNIGYAMGPRNNLPPAVVLPERLVHSTARVIPGQHAGEMGQSHDPWFIEASPFHKASYGAFPAFAFDHQKRPEKDERVFQAPQIALPHGLEEPQLRDRLKLLDSLNRQRRGLDAIASTNTLDSYRESAISMMLDSKVQSSLDVRKFDPRQLERYGANSFGWSVLMARNLVSTGVPLVQVNLGNNETWDTHGNAFPHLKEKLLPPMDQAVAALLEDLASTGQLDETLVVVASEFGRTPKISHLKAHYELPGRDHWGALQSVLFAGGGIHPGRVIGKSDSKGEFPIDSPVKPENFAATIYHLLGIPPEAVWKDSVDRPHAIYYGDPIAGLV